MKVGIVTIVDYTNFGNRLQNYATYYILKKHLNCDAITIAVNKEKAFCNGNGVAWLKGECARILCNISPTLAEKKFGNNITRWANFIKWSKLIPTKTYYGINEIPKSVNNQFDYFIAGSDQIWNYQFSSNEFYNYFLRFANNNKKIALSASFGVETIPDEWKQTYIDGLKDFLHLSVREEAGKVIVKQLIGKEIPVLIDPVMMIDEEAWLKVSKKPRIDCSKPYVLKYYLGDEAEEEKIDHWAKRNGYAVYELLNDQRPELYSAGPGEFISLIKNASLVCSDSFHCIAFSIIFSKPFIVYDRLGKDTGMSSRLDTLLGKFGFENRWKELLNENEYLQCDYSLCKVRLKEEQLKFYQYLDAIFDGGEKFAKTSR